MKIQVISRYAPIPNRAGHFSYLLDLIRYVRRAAFALELDVLDPWFLPDNIPDELHELADVILMPASYIAEAHEPKPAQSRQSLLHLFLRHLPPFVLAPLRQWWYHCRGKNIPGRHAPDAIATDAEMAFVADRLTRYNPGVFITNETFLGNLLTVAKNNSRILKINIAFDIQHKRQETFRKSGAVCAPSIWDRQKEVDLLSAADVIVAIHQEEAAILQNMLPDAEVICAPMAGRSHQHNETQQVRGRCLFVGSNIEHNVQGLQWFLETVWPQIRRQCPESVLHVCGTVCDAVKKTAPQARFLGRVDDLGPEYAAAEICLIPLVAGSGLKIKLIEALSHGRACVSTSVGVQGMQELKDKAVLVADTSQDFAQAVVSVLTNVEKRSIMEELAQRYVAEELSPEKAYQPFVDRIYEHVAQYQQKSERT